jgi:hypothetical protein
MEIQQIEYLNRGLETQTANQQRLLDELQKIIVSFVIESLLNLFF